MTLIFPLLNQEQIILLSDRRLTANGSIVDDEYNKAAFIKCANARLLVAFTGLARQGSFSTAQWLVDTVHEEIARSPAVSPLVGRLVDRATQRFRRLPAGVDKRLTIVVAGYVDEFDPPLACVWKITNFDGETTSSTARPEFESWYRPEARPNTGAFGLVWPVGFTAGVQRDRDLASLQTMLIEGKPTGALAAKAAAVMSRITERPESRGSIGPSYTSAVLYRDRHRPPSVDFHSQTVVNTIPFPNAVLWRPDVGPIALVRGKLSSPSPIGGPRIRGHHPCPCGSGRRFRHCHGRRMAGADVDQGTQLQGNTG